MRRVTVLSFIAVAVLILGAAANEFRPPKIHAVAMPGDDALTLRFRVSNPGFLVTMTEMDFLCRPLSVEPRDAAVKASPFPLDVHVDLTPGAALEYTCPVIGRDRAAAATNIRARVEVSYTRLGTRRQARSGTLVWDSQSRAWTDALS